MPRFSIDRQQVNVFGSAAFSLLVAVVLFGFLESTGTFEQGPVKLGGPVAAFVAIFLFMVWWLRPQGLDAQARKEGSPLVNYEIAKIVDLRHSPPTDTTQLVQISDHYLTRRTEANARLKLPYATSGDEINSVTTRPDTSTFVQIEGAHEGVEGKTYKNKYELDLDLTQEPEGAMIPIIIQLTYANAFKGPQGDSVETHVRYPTGHLAMMAILPESWRCIGAVGVVQLVHGGPTTELKPAPVVMEDGGLVYWAVDKPELHAAYQLRWKWKPRT